uniref:DNA_pol_D_N domain-containing protein n=1 Tax=Caenorhabditis tropicalis TaxID=1561998 RepID=A0A1I7T521_9PELO
METAWSNILEYKNYSSRYELTEKDTKGAFMRQYFEIYEARVKELKPRILENAERDIGKGKFKHIPLSEAKQDEEIFVVGVIVKRIEARPSILKTLLNEDKVTYDDYDEENEEDVKRYAGSSEDRIELESDKQTVRLEGSISMNECATGCCVGVLGALGKEGVFHVRRLVWPSTKITKSVKTDGTIVFVSGLELTGDVDDDQLTISGFEFMSEWINTQPGEKTNVLLLIV